MPARDLQVRDQSTGALRSSATFGLGLTRLSARAISVAVLTLFIAALLASMLGGLRLSTVVSPSMEPVISRGDAVLWTPAGTPPQVGDVVVYRRGVELIMHRVRDISDRGELTLRGDANLADDPDHPNADDIVGVVKMVVPKIGHVALWRRELPTARLGLIGAAAVACVFCALSPLPARRARRHEQLSLGSEAQQPSAPVRARAPEDTDDTDDAKERLVTDEQLSALVTGATR